MFQRAMDEEQPVFKVVDRRPFNPDGTPRELSPEEKEEAERAAKASAVSEAASQAAPPQPAPVAEDRARQDQQPETTASASRTAPAHSGDDPLDDPTSFLSLIMSLASNDASSGDG
jgi:hypothetical protein